MAVYEYECEPCQVVIEEMFSIGQAPEEIECSSCKGKARRIISQSTFHLKGNSWAAAGYTSAKARGAACGDAANNLQVDSGFSGRKK